MTAARAHLSIDLEQIWRTISNHRAFVATVKLETLKLTSSLNAKLEVNGTNFRCTFKRKDCRINMIHKRLIKSVFMHMKSMGYCVVSLCRMVGGHIYRPIYIHTYAAGKYLNAPSDTILLVYSMMQFKKLIAPQKNTKLLCCILL